MHFMNYQSNKENLTHSIEFINNVNGSCKFSTNPKLATQFDAHDPPYTIMHSKLTKQSKLFEFKHLDVAMALMATIIGWILLMCLPNLNKPLMLAWALLQACSEVCQKLVAVLGYLLASELPQSTQPSHCHVLLAYCHTFLATSLLLFYCPQSHAMSIRSLHVCMATPKHGIGALFFLGSFPFYSQPSASPYFARVWFICL